jgi:predicted outer membrane repeat protein
MPRPLPPHTCPRPRLAIPHHFTRPRPGSPLTTIILTPEKSNRFTLTLKAAPDCTNGARPVLSSSGAPTMHNMISLSGTNRHLVMEDVVGGLGWGLGSGPGARAGRGRGGAACRGTGPRRPRPARRGRALPRTRRVVPRCATRPPGPSPFLPPPMIPRTPSPQILDGKESRSGIVAAHPIGSVTLKNVDVRNMRFTALDDIADYAQVRASPAGVSVAGAAHLLLGPAPPRGPTPGLGARAGRAPSPEPAPAARTRRPRPPPRRRSHPGARSSHCRRPQAHGAGLRLEAPYDKCSITGGTWSNNAAIMLGSGPGAGKWKDGGAIFYTDGRSGPAQTMLTITNTVFTGNAAARGGAIFFEKLVSVVSAGRLIPSAWRGPAGKGAPPQAASEAHAPQTARARSTRRQAADSHPCRAPLQPQP